MPKHTNKRAKLYKMSLLCALSLHCVPTETPCGPSHGVVKRVLDGDTIELTSGEKVRYLMIDTPEIAHNASETAECFANEAKQFNSNLVLGKDITLRYDEVCTDRYDRLLAYVSLEDREINALLVERGFACLLYIPPNGIERKLEFKSLQSRAKQQNRGLWGVCESTPC